MEEDKPKRTYKKNRKKATRNRRNKQERSTHNPFAGGRPRLYQTPEKMRLKVEDYFAYCEIDDTPMTVAGLAGFLNMSKAVLVRYRKGEHDHHTPPGQETFSELLTKAREFVENDRIVNALKGNYVASIAIFDLKNNHGYAEKSDVNVTENPTPVVLDDIPADGASKSKEITIIEDDYEDLY